jgi:hypothetical protein
MSSAFVRVVAYFHGPDQFVAVRDALGPDATFHEGMAEGEMPLYGVAGLVAAGVTVERLATEGPGTEPTPEFAAAEAQRAAAADAAVAERTVHSDEPEAGDRAATPSRVGSVRSFVGAILGALVSALGVLVLLQQLGSVDPTAQTAVSTLAAGALVAAIAVVVRLLIGRARQR